MISQILHSLQLLQSSTKNVCTHEWSVNEKKNPLFPKKSKTNLKKHGIIYLSAGPIVYILKF